MTHCPNHCFRASAQSQPMSLLWRFPSAVPPHIRCQISHRKRRQDPFRSLPFAPSAQTVPTSSSDRYCSSAHWRRDWRIRNYGKASWRKADRAWTPGWICERMREPKGEKRKANGRSPRTVWRKANGSAERSRTHSGMNSRAKGANERSQIGDRGSIRRWIREFSRFDSGISGSPLRCPIPILDWLNPTFWRCPHRDYLRPSDPFIGSALHWSVPRGRPPQMGHHSLGRIRSLTFPPDDKQ